LMEYHHRMMVWLHRYRHCFPQHYWDHPDRTENKACVRYKCEHANLDLQEMMSWPSEDSFEQLQYLQSARCGYLKGVRQSVYDYLPKLSTSRFPSMQIFAAAKWVRSAARSWSVQPARRGAHRNRTVPTPCWRVPRLTSSNS
jgi:hypothetical protein